jgi:hypothetical protein
MEPQNVAEAERQCFINWLYYNEFITESEKQRISPDLKGLDKEPSRLVELFKPCPTLMKKA